MKMRCAVAAAIFMMAWMPVQGAGDFYDGRLAAGRTALAAGKLAEADEDFEIAAFGMLDRPRKLAEAVALSAVARDRKGDTAGRDESIDRFVRVAEKFGVYEPAIAEPFREEFEALLRKRIPRSRLDRLAGGAQPQPPAGGHDRALKLLAEGNPAAAATLLTELIAREPQRRELRLSLLQAAVQSSNWTVARRQVSILQPFHESEVVSMFYGAVALFETGNVTAARQLLARGLPRLRRTPYVDSYVRKIEGSS